MKQRIKAEHYIVGGRPMGGHTSAVGLDIDWQMGPLVVDGKRRMPNGCFVETLIESAINRLEFYQCATGGKFKCRENALAITKLEEALHWLNARTAAREARGVEGTHEV